MNYYYIVDVLPYMTPIASNYQQRYTSAPYSQSPTFSSSDIQADYLIQQPNLQRYLCYWITLLN